MLEQILVSYRAVVNATTDFRQAIPEVAARVGDRRTACAMDIAASGMVYAVGEIGSGMFRVKSQSNPIAGYDVDERPGYHACTCPDYPRVFTCKHRLAVYLALAALCAQAREDADKARAREDDLHLSIGVEQQHQDRLQHAYA